MYQESVCVVVPEEGGAWASADLEKLRRALNTLLGSGESALSGVTEQKTALIVALDDRYRAAFDLILAGAKSRILYEFLPDESTP